MIMIVKNYQGESCRRLWGSQDTAATWPAWYLSCDCISDGGGCVARLWLVHYFIIIIY